MKFFKIIRYFFRSIFLFLNILAVLAYIIAYSGMFISPAKHWLPAFLALGFPYIALCNILFIVLWIVRRKKLFLISFITILASFNLILRFFQISFTEHSSKTASFKVLTYNIRHFSIFQNNNIYNAKKEIVAFIKKEKPDIICFQEFFSKGIGENSTIDSLTKELKLKYTATSLFKRSGKNFNGLVIFSRFPIIKQGEHLFDKGLRNCHYADIVIRKDTIRLFNNHLQSNHFGKEEYNAIDSIKANKENKHSRIYSILRKLKRAYVKRSYQAEVISGEIKKSPYPVLVCGDFNDTPVSYVYETVRGNLNDAFEEAGNGLAFTYERGIFNFRIDFVLSDKRLKPQTYDVQKVNYSDHYPVLSNFLIEK